MASTSPVTIQEEWGSLYEMPFEIVGDVCLRKHSLGDIVQYVTLGYTNKFDSGVHLFHIIYTVYIFMYICTYIHIFSYVYMYIYTYICVYNTLPRSTTCIRLAFDASIKM